MFINLGAAMITLCEPFMTADKVRILAVSVKKRLPAFVVHTCGTADGDTGSSLSVFHRLRVSCGFDNVD
jgi:hypothetical protein